MPKILNVIEQSKIKAYEQSANGISDAAKFKQIQKFLKMVNLQVIIHLPVEITLMKVKNYHLKEIHHTQECYI